MPEGLSLFFLPSSNINMVAGLMWELEATTVLFIEMDRLSDCDKIPCLIWPNNILFSPLKPSDTSLHRFLAAIRAEETKNIPSHLVKLCCSCVSTHTILISLEINPRRPLIGSQLISPWQFSIYDRFCRIRMATAMLTAHKHYFKHWCLIKVFNVTTDVNKGVLLSTTSHSG